MKPTFLQRIKAAGAALKNVVWTSGDWVGGDLPGNRSSGDGSWGRMADIDFSRYSGTAWNCPAFQAGLNFLMRNAPQATPILQREDDNGRWIRLPRDERVAAKLVNGRDDLGDALALVRRPMKGPGAYGWTQMVGAILLSLNDKDRNGGNAYIGVTWNQYHTRPVELRYLPHWRITPIKLPKNQGEPLVDTLGNLIDYYEYRINGQVQRLEVDEVIHIRFGIDPWNMKNGLTPTGSNEEGIYTLKRGAKFTATLMKNGTATDKMFTPKNNEDTLDPDAFVEEYQSNHSGENLGKVGAYSIPLDMHDLGSTPQEMALETLPDRSESDIAATMGVPAAVTGLHTSRNSRTYSNQKEAREEVWEGTVVPWLGIIFDALTCQLLPMFGIDDISVRYYCDLMNVSALSPERDRIHQRYREDYRAQCIDRYTYKIETGRVATDADKDVYYTGFTNPNDGRGQTGGSPNDNMNAEESSSTRNGKAIHLNGAAA